MNDVIGAADSAVQTILCPSNEVQLLGELQLALVGGGIGTVTVA